MDYDDRTGVSDDQIARRWLLRSGGAAAVAGVATAAGGTAVGAASGNWLSNLIGGLLGQKKPPASSSPPTTVPPAPTTTVGSTPPTTVMSPSTTMPPTTVPATTIPPSTTTPTTVPPTPPPVSSPTPAQQKARHLANRLTYGPTPTLLAELETNPSGWLTAQLSPGSVNDSTVEAMVASYPVMTTSPVDLYTTYGTQSNTSLRQWWMVNHLRHTYSNRQLHERLVDFWSDHLNCPATAPAIAYLLPSWDRDVLRAHTHGRYADMLHASATHPAMLFYLDNWLSWYAHPNENYAREMLELHTVGVDHVTESDVHNAARLLAGHTVDVTTLGYMFYAPFHQSGPVTIGTFHRTSTGQSTLREYTDYLARHPETARHIARKLIVRFVTETPTETFVDQIANVYLGADTALNPVYQAIFTSPEFAGSAGTKLRRTGELASWLARAWQIPYNHAAAVSGGKLDADATQIATGYLFAGHGPGGWLPPNGYPDANGYWANPATFNARNYLTVWFVYGLLANPRMPSNIAGLIPATDGTPIGAIVDQVFAYIHHRPATDNEKAAYTAATGQAMSLAVPAVWIETVARFVAVLASVHPDAQWR